MPKKEVTNITGSVKARLLNYSQKNSLEFNSVLLQYLQERLLFRISKSIYSQNFILKGALLFLAHDISRLRPTKDIDLLGKFLPNELDSMKEIFIEVCSIKYEDGILFDRIRFLLKTLRNKTSITELEFFLLPDWEKQNKKSRLILASGILFILIQWKLIIRHFSILKHHA
ncbi:MAG: nucleotidyl transferase AbiEii/AbiGii toxin family protein [Bacteroidetes bacterium]|nr:nucleotidyl transferase AbiEii/AbiGii toxin family protein [Bacteroidota bacterium]MBU2584514.1 nucleotidyl transferase AbiEii/AbiGii toxin family protein [Bacteroidota bacterium]